MITLYKYLRESIFDDEEEILDNVKGQVVAQNINKEILKITQNIHSKKDLDIYMRDLGHEYKSHFKGNKLVIQFPDYWLDFSKELYPNLLEVVKKGMDLMGSDTIEFDNDTSHNQSISFDGFDIDDKFAKTFILNNISPVINGNNDIKNINIIINNQNVAGYAMIINRDFGEAGFSNANIEVNSNQRQVKSFVELDRYNASSIYKANLINPLTIIFKNCKVSGVEKIVINQTSTTLTQSSAIKEMIDGVLDSKHTYNINSSDKVTKRKGNYHNAVLQATKSMDTIEGKLFAFKPNASINDIIDTKGFKDLKCITINSSRHKAMIRIIRGDLMKSLDKDNRLITLPTVEKFPNDDWYLMFTKNYK